MRVRAADGVGPLWRDRKAQPSGRKRGRNLSSSNAPLFGHPVPYCGFQKLPSMKGLVGHLKCGGGLQVRFRVERWRKRAFNIAKVCRSYALPDRAILLAGLRK